MECVQYFLQNTMSQATGSDLTRDTLESRKFFEVINSCISRIGAEKSKNEHYLQILTKKT
jgi:hypothetical protein